MIDISMNTILPMLDIMDKFNAGCDIRDELNQLLDYKDYQIELERYQNHSAGLGFTKEDYIEYFANIRNIDENKISSKALKYRINDLLQIIDNVEYYRELYRKIENFDKSNILKAIERAKVGLPNDIELNYIRVIFSIGLGVSGGWIYKNNTHYDLKAVVDKKTHQGLLNTIAHECHHMGYNKMFDNTVENKSEEPIDSTLILYFSGEGTAVKYCNNFEGVLTKKIYKDEEFSINRISYDYYCSNFHMIYNTFKCDIRALRSGEIKNMREFEDLFANHYLYRNVIIDGKLYENYLGQPIVYHLGADIWGLIHDTYGREKVFELLRDPKDFFMYYNEALIKINRKDLCII